MRSPRPPACYIRRMRPEDIAQVLDIERESFPSMWPKTVYQRELKNDLARYLVACQPLNDTGEAPSPDEQRSPGLLKRLLGGATPDTSNERVLAVVGLWLMVDEAHIVTIAVRSELLRRGLGELLVVASLDAARVAGLDAVTLEYRISNNAARALYSKYGFEQIGVRARYYSDNNEDAVLMMTPALDEPAFRDLIAKRIAEQRARWGAGYPLDNMNGLLKPATA